jgi:hypothetical protein
MRVDGAAHHNWQAQQAPGQAKAKQDEVYEAVPVAKQPEAAPEYEGRAKGVIRNLMEGHFKGVADVRLRINFHEELTGLEQSRVAEAIAPQNESLQDLAADLEELRALAADSEELAEAGFGDEVQQLLDRISLFLGEDGLSAEQAQTAAGELREAFDRLSVFLGDLLAPAEEPVEEALLAEAAPAEEPEPAAAPPEEAAGEEPAPAVEEEPLLAAAPGEEPAEEAPEEPDPFMDTVKAFLDRWSAVLPALVTELQEGLAGVATLPPLSEPSGNGGAYAKFVAIYETLYHQAATPVAEEEPYGIEVVA